MPGAVRDVAGSQQVMDPSDYGQYWKITQHLGRPSARLSPVPHPSTWHIAATILASNPRPRALRFNFVLGALTTFSENTRNPTIELDVMRVEASHGAYGESG